MILIYIYIYSLALWLKYLPLLRHTTDLKMVLDASLLITQYYKVWIKGKWHHSLHIGVVVIEKGAVGSPSTMVG